MHYTSASAAWSHLRDDTIRSTMVLLPKKFPHSAGAELSPCSWSSLPLLVQTPPPPAGGASSPQQLPLVGSVEVVQLLQQPSVSRPHNGLWSATAQYVSAPIAAAVETQEGQYCKSALHLNSKVTPETQWRTHCSRMHNSFLQKGTLHCFRHKVEQHSM